MAGEVEVIAKIKPKNDAFVGVCDAAQVLDGTQSFGVYMQFDSKIPVGFQRYRYIPFDCTIIGWELVGNVAGDVVIDIKKCAAASMPNTVSIIGTGTKPTLSSAIYATDSTLTDWSTALTAGDVVEFYVESSGDAPTFINLDVRYRRPVLG